MYIVSVFFMEWMSEKLWSGWAWGFVEATFCCFFTQKFFRRRNIKDLLPGQPVKNVRVEAWWLIHVGYITEDDIRVGHAHLHDIRVGHAHFNQQSPPLVVRG